MLYKLRDIIVAIIDFVHIPFKKFIPAQTFRYLACGGGNTVLGLLLFKLIYDYVFHSVDSMQLGGLALSTRVATLFMTFCVNFPVGFLLSSYVVFPESQLKGRVQLFRYTIATFSFILMAYLLTKFFANHVPQVSAPVANIFVSILTAILSYITQKIYTFKITPEETIEG